MPRAPADLARFIDHTLLAPAATAADIENLCDEARRYGLFAVCVASSRVALARRCLRGSPVKIAAVVGFPHGSAVSVAKVREAAEAIGHGADELDMVLNLGALKDGAFDLVRADIQGVVDAASGRPVKVILETGCLNREEKVAGAVLACMANASFVKTSTGFGPAAVLEEDVRLLRRAVGSRAGVKASGGIRSARQAIAMIEAGATRIGTSRGAAIVRAS